MKVRWKLLLTLLAALLALTASIGIGSVGIAPLDILRILGHQMFGLPLGENIDAITVSILWKIRLPRTLLAFLVGGALAASGHGHAVGAENRWLPPIPSACPRARRWGRRR